MERQYIYDDKLMHTLLKERIKFQHVRISLLDFNTEKTLFDISGKIQNEFTLSIDNESNIRRSCSLTFVPDVNDRIYDLAGLNKKIKVKIGYENTLKHREDFSYYRDIDIFWYTVGVFVISDCRINNTTEDWEVSLSLSDKMCLLNGDIAGVIPDETELSQKNEIDENGKETTVKVPIYQIISEVVNHYGGEPEQRILISGIPKYILSPAWWCPESPNIHLWVRYTDTKPKRIANYLVINGDEEPRNFTEIKNGEYFGYYYSPFYYVSSDGELSTAAGSTVESVLSMINDYLGGAFEYFYDKNGYFHFQKKRTYINDNVVTEEDDVNMTDYTKQLDYFYDYYTHYSLFTFDDKEIISSIQGVPSYKDCKNDFFIWGTQKTGDDEKKVLYHLSFNHKPLMGKKYRSFITTPNPYFKDLDANTISGSYKGRNVELAEVYHDKTYFPKKGYELIYYLAEHGSPRDFNTLPTLYMWKDSENDYIEVSRVNDSKHPLYIRQTSVDDVPINCYEWWNVEIENSDWRTELFFQMMEDYNNGITNDYYYPQLKAWWYDVYDIGYRNENGKYGKFRDSTGLDIKYYLDFLRFSNATSMLDVKAIGHRPYVETNDNINCLFEPEIAHTIFYKEEYKKALLMDTENNISDYNKKVIDEDSDLITFLDIDGASIEYIRIAEGAKWNAAYDKVKDLLETYSTMNQQISIETLPILFLDSNNIIEVKDKKTNTYGQYIINDINLSLTNGTCEISASSIKNRL